jgi:C-terminal processing protease CtpA/Prc
VPLPQVTLAVQPANGGGRRDVTLTRQPIQYQPVTAELCRGGGGGGGADGSTPLGYIRVATFSKQTPDAVRDAVRSLQVRAQTLLQS